MGVNTYDLLMGIMIVVGIYAVVLVACLWKYKDDQR